MPRRQIRDTSRKVRAELDADEEEEGERGQVEEEQA